MARILIVDDDVLSTKIYLAKLNNDHHEVVLCQNGQDALAKIITKFDLVLLDMIMPDKNGREVFLEILSINPDAKVIIASGFSRNEDVAGLKEKGLCAFLPKPFQRSELSRIIGEVLNR